MAIRPLGIVLIGSAARGELSWFDDGNRHELLSDLEYIIFTDGQSDRGPYGSLQNRLMNLTEGLTNTNPHYHVDYVIIPIQKAPRLSRNLAVYEMKELGKTLFGEPADLLKLPTVKVNNIDIRSLNNLVLVRLWWLLSGIPKNIVSGGATAFEKLLLQYVSCRNLLDIPTILLPNDGYLIAGYAKRADFISNNYHLLPSRVYMGDDFPEHVSTALQKKIILKFAVTETQEYSATLDLYVRLIRYLMTSAPDISVVSLCGRLSKGRTMFNAPLSSRQGVRRLLKGGRRWIRDFSPPNPWPHVRPIEGHLMAIMLLMHYSLNDKLQGQTEDAGNWLSMASECLQDIDWRPIPNRASFSERWLDLRLRLADILYDNFSVFGRRRSFIGKLLDWEDPGDVRK